MKRPNILAGFLWGGLLAIPLVAVMFLGMSVAGLPFTPFETFEWVTRVLPGSVVRFGIDTMVKVLMLLGLSTAEASKPAEAIQAVGLLLAIAAVAGLIFFVVLNATQTDPKKRPGIVPGVILGLLMGVPLLYIAFQVDNSASAASPIRALIWVVGLFVLWGIVVGTVWNRLAFRSSATPADSAAADSATATAAVEALDRRSFLVRMGAGAAVITVVGAGLGVLLKRGEDVLASPLSVADTLAAATPDASATALPNANDPVVPVPGTRPEITPLASHYRIDINIVPPSVDASSYKLQMINQVNGAGTLLHEYTVDDIRAMPSTDAYVTQGCISNELGGDLISTILWTGVSMQYFLAQVGIPDSATHLKITAVDGFDETVALDTIRNDERVMLAYAWENQPLTQAHGFPLRIHIPNRYGMKQPKWIQRMEFLDHDDDGYWVVRGWDKDAIVRATSVIDTVALDNRYDSNGHTVVPIGGIAWAGARGISQVQVRVDHGEWQDAQLRAPVSDRTWVIWRYNWEYVDGHHTFEVRCAEGDGTPQIESVAAVAPSGATGIVSYSI